MPAHPPIVFERGWLSSNNILLRGRHGNALIDTGYASHAAQTLALVQQALQEAPLHAIVNTHLHSDHCGGNLALQQHWPGCATRIPAASAAAVADWDETALSFAATGQQCPRFGFTATLQGGDELPLGDAHWQVHAAPGHDPDMVVLFEPASRTLISADALWQHGFGVIFPELDGVQAFDVMAATLDAIERLQPLHIIPGHGAPFTEVAAALATAHRRLDAFAQNPARHAHYAAKALLKFKLLEWQRIHRDALGQWVAQLPYFGRLRLLMGGNAAAAAGGAATDPDGWLDDLLADLVRSGAARREDGGWIFNQ
ncbi:MBL fold metallo-hydrolase [Corticibacter populi]|uniref:MBL fold metallo-hydrolase n=1 Tax=Corticibacter populi TaxID=1550736 RepID=A0A3M6QRX0_9BURK|nr:MBL fold metallo-hydrolase [Corticibacter populi]RMX05795.1 MBL fold metallo-hydrolase [Corticibacter populi]RZS30895.1 glyoxylase-like metal-dependent hydrolase (beta-lactamase superfamily II) [Corticibacter populi]